jgi:inorganic pyrophosphatase
MAKVTDERFWAHLDALVAGAAIHIDRPAGSAHPRYPAAIYPLDYGYLAGTTTVDGDGIDVWIGSLPDAAVVGVVCTVDLTKRDSEIKVLLGCTPQEARTVLAFHNAHSQAALLIPRPPDN